MTAVGSNSVIRRCRLNGRFARQRTWSDDLCLTIRGGVSGTLLAVPPETPAVQRSSICASCRRPSNPIHRAACETWQPRPSFPGLRQLRSVEITDHGHCRLLRVRPCGRRAAEYGQQFPPSDGDCHTPLPREVRKGKNTARSACSLHVREGGDAALLSASDLNDRCGPGRAGRLCGPGLRACGLTFR